MKLALQCIVLFAGLIFCLWHDTPNGESSFPWRVLRAKKELPHSLAEIVRCEALCKIVWRSASLFLITTIIVLVIGVRSSFSLQQSVMLYPCLLGITLCCRTVTQNIFKIIQRDTDYSNVAISKGILKTALGFLGLSFCLCCVAQIVISAQTT